MVGMSHCEDDCARMWPPLAAPKSAKAFGDWSVIPRPDGSAQWAYKTKPLYTYSEDRPGEPARGLAGAQLVAGEMSMKSLVIAFAVLAAPLAAFGAARVEVLQPWSRPAAAGTNGIGYMVLVNHGGVADVLEKVESPLAARVEMHSSSMAGGVMSMRKEDRVPVPAGGQAIFGPGAYHLMLSA